MAISSLETAAIEFIFWSGPTGRKIRKEMEEKGREN